MCINNVSPAQALLLLMVVRFSSGVVDDESQLHDSALIVNPSQFVFMALKYRAKTMPSGDWEMDAVSGETKREEREFPSSNSNSGDGERNKRGIKKQIPKAYECAVLSRPQLFRSTVVIEFTECEYTGVKTLSKGYSIKGNKYVYSTKNKKTALNTLEGLGYKGMRYDYTNVEEETVRSVATISTRGKSKSKCCLFRMKSNDGNAKFTHLVPFEAYVKRADNVDKGKDERYMAHNGVALLPTDRDNLITFVGFQVKAEEYSLKAKNKKAAESSIPTTDLTLALKKRLQSQQSYENMFLCEIQELGAGFKAVSVEVVPCTKRDLTLSGRKKPSFDHAMLNDQGDLVRKYFSTTIGTFDRLKFGGFCCQFKLVERVAAKKRLPLELQALRVIKVVPKSKSVT